MSADPTLTAALGADGAWVFAALRIATPARTLRLLDGSARVTIDGEVYTGRDAVFGAPLSADPVEESQDNEAPESRIEFQPESASALVDLCNPAMQGSEIRWMIGCLDPATGLIIGTPEQIALMEIDVPTAKLRKKGRTVGFTTVSVMERLFAVDEGERATDGAHQNVWPGELGLSGMTGTVQKLYWGSHPPSGAATGGQVGRGIRFDNYEIPA